jgi:hypothetical protein
LLLRAKVGKVHGLLGLHSKLSLTQTLHKASLLRAHAILCRTKPLSRLRGTKALLVHLLTKASQSLTSADVLAKLLLAQSRQLLASTHLLGITLLGKVSSLLGAKLLCCAVGLCCSKVHALLLLEHVCSLTVALLEKTAKGGLIGQRLLARQISL